MYIKRLLKKQLMLSTITVIGILIAIAGASYALFYTIKSNSTDQTIAVGDLNVTYSGGSSISITDIEPLTDAEALSLTTNIYTLIMLMLDSCMEQQTLLPMP